MSSLAKAGKTDQEKALPEMRGLFSSFTEGLITTTHVAVVPRSLSRGRSNGNLMSASKLDRVCSNTDSICHTFPASI